MVPKSLSLSYPIPPSLSYQDKASSDANESSTPKSRASIVSGVVGPVGDRYVVRTDCEGG